MKFFNRTDEKSMLTRALASKTGSFCCLYGRRRCGKSRLLLEVLQRKRSVFHVADQMEPTLQRHRLASDVAAVIPGFDRVAYPDWSSLLDRWSAEAPPGTCLALDEFPYMVEQSPEIPSILQRVVDRMGRRRLHLIICGSSQRMMQNFVLDSSAPLYGRAREILKIAPLSFGWIAKAFPNDSPYESLERFSIFGGVPRYWELAADFSSLDNAVANLILSPQGVLHSEPRHLLMDDLSDVAQASSILALIGQGCHRLSEIAARLEKPATSLTRPLGRLLELDLIIREIPFGADERNSKKSLYRLADPFMGFWFRFVQPNRSQLDTAPVSVTQRNIHATFSQHVAEVFEFLARRSVPHLTFAGQRWGAGRRWWGNGLDGKPMEIDVVSESSDGTALLVGEVKVSASASEIKRILAELKEKISLLPCGSKYQKIETAVFSALPQISVYPVIMPEVMLKAML
ncbi:MAG: ATP-binding protein [Candidatus Riflebacteria bacterium]|nr:ATP-binding protein [Candidatus Riflebacteria bacterium]